MSTTRLTRLMIRGAASLLMAMTGTFLTPAVSLALPVADFSFAPDQPVAGEPVTFTFTGSCDAPPCRIQWRSFQDGGSSLGSTMGEGAEITYAFDTEGSYRVVAKITNAQPTHGSATATHVVAVGKAAGPPGPPVVQSVVVQDRERALVLDRWSGRASISASRGGYRIGHGRATLSFSGTRAVYVAVTGPALGVAEIAVDHGPARRVDLYSPVAARRSWTIRAAPGRHQLSVRSTGARAKDSTGTAVTVDEFVVGVSGSVVHVDDRSPRVSFGHWAGSRRPSASGGTVRAASTHGARVRIAFTGTSLTWVTATGRDQGRARVLIDGTAVATVDNHAAAPTALRARSYSGLSAGAHTATIVVLRGARGSAAAVVTIDAFKLDGSNQPRSPQIR